jgi:hypothetical protein
VHALEEFQNHLTTTNKRLEELLEKAALKVKENNDEIAILKSAITDAKRNLEEKQLENVRISTQLEKISFFKLQPFCP